MKLKIFSLLIFAILILGLVNASFNLNPTTLSFTPKDDSKSFTITNTNTSELLSVSLPVIFTIKGNDDYLASFNFDGSTSNINASEPRTVTISPTSEIDFSNFDFGRKYSSSFEVSDGTINKSISVELERPYCEFGNNGDLTLDVEIENLGDYGDDEEWYMFDEIEVEIEVRNNLDEKMKRVVVEWGLYNTQTGKFVIDDEESSFTLDDNERETILVSFKINPEDFDEEDSEEDFVFLVKAYSEEFGEDEQCISYSNTGIEIIRDNHFVVVSDVEVPEQVSCGETITINAEVWNIGDDEEEDILLVVQVVDLDFKKIIEVGDLDIYEDEKVSFEIEIPQDAEEGTYGLRFEVYDEDSDLFENDNDDVSIFTEIFDIEGNCKIPSSVEISADLESEATAGKEMNVKIYLENTGLEQTEYKISITDYDVWAKLNSISSDSLTINSGETEEITLILIPNKDVSGEREFKIQVLYDGEVAEQSVKVDVSPRQGFSLTGLTIGENIKENWLIWLIALINIVLIILIIIVAIKIARR
jgi:hypothetical protein